VTEAARPHPGSRRSPSDFVGDPRSRRLVTFLFCVLLLGSPGGSREEKDPIDRRWDACVERDPTTAGMVRCAEEALRAWDEEMNRVYRELQGRLDPGGREALRTAQRAWPAWRDAEFRFIGRLYGSRAGTMYLPMEVGRRVDLVRRRTLELRAYRALAAGP